MMCRLWFWTEKNPKPRILDTGEGTTLEHAAFVCLAPVDQPAWKKERRNGQLYISRGLTGYCCESVDGPGPNLGPPIGKKRLRLEDAPVVKKPARERLKI
jgi:hypothetical protein